MSAVLPSELWRENNMNDMEYRYFFEVARTLNFNQAAENLFITQPALSKCISKLEHQFGVRLFTRSKHQVRLTDAGIALLHQYPPCPES